MPPSPAMRISPGRELKADNHKRGRSLESGILFREKDDDLDLFNDVQKKEKENFLLQSNDDFDDIFCKSLYPVISFGFCSIYDFGVSEECCACTIFCSLRTLADRCRYLSFMVDSDKIKTLL